ncbi:MAG TPA: VWA domain-containing protein [Edaphobacter sp.]|nr:VWA domain-containing protein [Edaphobacter sp.]
MTRGLLMTALFFASAGILCAQNSPPDTIQSTTRLVVVPTLVQTPANEVVYSLRAEDFLLTDKGVPQKIRIDDEAHQPLSLVVLMQTGGAAVHEFEKYRSLETMLAPILGEAPNQVSIVNFDSRPEAASPFTSDIAQWTDAINHPDSGDSGAAIMDGLKFSLDLLAKQPPANRRAILLISQPTDVGSKTTAKEILRVSGETNTAIYTLTFSPQMTQLKDSLNEVHSNPPIHLGNGDYVAYFNLSQPLGIILAAMRKNVAAEMASLSGGEAAAFENQHQLDDGLATLNSHIRNRYTLSFTPTSAEPGLHPIQVRLPSHPELVVSARTNYWLSDPGSAPPKQ